MSPKPPDVSNRLRQNPSRLSDAGCTLAIANVNDALALLQTACSSMVAQLLQAHAYSAVVQERAAERVAAAESAAHAAIERVTLESETQIRELSALVDQLRKDLHSERERSISSTVVPTAPDTQPAAGMPPCVDAAADSTNALSEDVRDFDPAAYAQQLLDEIEAVYHADATAALPLDEIVERLTDNVRYGAMVFGRRAGLPSAQRHAVFDQQLTAALTAKEGTLFGRHLGIAAYEYDRR